MPRPPAPPDRAHVAPEDLADYDLIAERVVAKFGAWTPYHGAIANSPPFGAALNVLGRLARTAGDRPGSYSHADRELVDQVLSVDFQTNVVLGIHTPDALAAGVRAEAIEALRTGHEERLTDDERFLATYIRAVAGGGMTDELYAAMERRLGPRGTVEYTIFIGFLVMTIRLWQAFGMEDMTDEQHDALLAELRDGTREIPDFRERIG